MRRSYSGVDGSPAVALRIVGFAAVFALTLVAH
jgi:hypothetical protein